MFRTPRTTIVFVDADRIVRAEIDAQRRRVVDLTVRSRPLNSDLASTVELALQTGAKPGKTWVLSTDLWSQQVTVAAQNVEGLTDAETARALGFEAESLSGVSAMDSELGFVLLGSGDGLRHYWATQIPSGTRDRVHAAVRAARGRLAGLLHPAGVPAPLAGGADSGSHAKWSRIEAWPGVMLTLRGNEDEVEYRFANPERRGEMRESTERWNESLAVGTALPSGIAADATFRLDADQQLSTWLQRWAGVLEQGAARIPHIQPPVQPVGKMAYVAASLILAGALGSAIAFDWHRLDRGATESLAASQRFKRDADDLKAIQTEVAKLEKQVAAKEASNRTIVEDLSNAEAQRSAQRERWSELLRILAKQSSPHFVIQEISATDNSVTIRGKCLGNAVAASMASEIEAAIRPLGWSLTPRHTTDGLSNVYEFALELRDAEPVRAAPTNVRVATEASRSASVRGDTKE